MASKIIDGIKKQIIAKIGKHISSNYPIIFLYNNKSTEIEYSSILIAQMQIFKHLRLEPIVEYIVSYETLDLNIFEKTAKEKATVVFGGYDSIFDNMQMELMEKYPQHNYIQLPQEKKIIVPEKTASIILKVNKYIIFYLFDSYYEELKKFSSNDNIICEKCYHPIFLIEIEKNKNTIYSSFLIIQKSSNENEEKSKEFIIKSKVNQIKNLSIVQNLKNNKKINFNWKIYQTKYCDITDIILLTSNNLFYKLSNREKTNIGFITLTNYLQNISCIFSDRLYIIILCLVLQTECFLVKDTLTELFFKEYNSLFNFPENFYHDNFDSTIKLIKKIKGKDKEYKFQNDNLIPRLDKFKEIIGLQGLDDVVINFLVINPEDGCSIIWFLENIITNQKSKIYCIDTFNDKNNNSYLEAFNYNIKTSGRTNIEVIQTDPNKGMLNLLIKKTKFDIIFIDGIFTSILAGKYCYLAFELLKTNGIMIIDDYLFCGYSSEVVTSNKHYLFPKYSIDNFLNCVSDQIKIINRNYILAFKKTRSISDDKYRQILGKKN
jgi:hypothetical protein